MVFLKKERMLPKYISPCSVQPPALLLRLNYFALDSYLGEVAISLNTDQNIFNSVFCIPYIPSSPSPPDWDIK
jgi:hypothetical protein